LLKLPCSPFILPFRAVHCNDIDRDLLLNGNTFTICEKGIFPNHNYFWSQSIQKPFLIIEFKYGWTNSQTEPAREGTRLLEVMKKLGANPEPAHVNSGRDTCFWFDVSSQEVRAYYCLILENYADQTLVMVELHCTRIDEIILQNVQTLDTALSFVLTACGIAER